MRIGLHTSISKSLEGAALRAAELGANTFQIFSASPRQWKASSPSAASIALLNRARDKYDLKPLVIHDNYLINLAAADEVVWAKSVEAFRGELERAIAIGAEFLVAHPGNYKGQTVEQGIFKFLEGNLPGRGGPEVRQTDAAGRVHGGRGRPDWRALRRAGGDPRIRAAYDGSAGRLLSRYLPSARFRARCFN